jgi:filamentous hemagglutinin family protein
MACTPRAYPSRLRWIRALLLSGVLWQSILVAISHTQITSDGSLGPGGPLTGPHYRIGAELGQIRGGNLFHSFGAFNVPTGGSATFTGPNTIANILGRVTGGQPSSIDGVLRSETAGANLFLLNPSGVPFGPNARLDVRGSFHVSTADFLRFADGAKFFANLGQESVLTVAPPAAFGFLGPNPAAMTIEESVLQVPTGQILSLVGGDITIVGGPLGVLHAAGGRVQLASVASAGEVVFSRLELAPDLQVDSFTHLGRLELSQGALLDVSGNGGGTVLVRSGRLRVDGSAIFADNLGDVHGTGLGVDLWVAADAVITNGALITTDSFKAGRAKDLQLHVGSLTLTGGAQIGSGSFDAGRSGDVTVAATEAIAIAGRNRAGRSGLFNNAFSNGNAGRLFVSTPLLSMDGGFIQSGTAPESRGNAGDLEVRGGRLTLTEGAEISTSTDGSGRGGMLTVMASEAITIRGQDSQGRQ